MAAKTNVLYNTDDHYTDLDQIAFDDAQVEAELNQQYEAYCEAQLEKEKQDAQYKITLALQAEPTPKAFFVFAFKMIII